MKIRNMMRWSLSGLNRCFLRGYADKNVKRAIVAVGMTTIVLTAVIGVNPQPFVRFGYAGVFGYSLFGTGTIIVPALAKYLNLYILATIAALGMMVNDSLTWLVGRSGEELVPPGRVIVRLEYGIKKYGVAALFFWALIPFPFDVVGLLAGYLGIPFWKFALATFLGRWVRFVALGQGWGWYTQSV